MKKVLGLVLAICMVAMICVMPISASAAEVDINMREYDTDGDGEYNLYDIVFLAQVVADWDVEYEKDACDINQDDVINVVDITDLAKHFAGWSGY
ncbi:MAG: hypothetical protein IJN95_00595 [Clostridia bacterium]|nr:hypothetical protein [Clostridia bacterium]